MSVRNRRGPRGGYVLCGAILACAILTGCRTPVGGGRSPASDDAVDVSVAGQGKRITAGSAAGRAFAGDLDEPESKRIDFSSTPPAAKRRKTIRRPDGINTIPPAGEVGL